MHHLWKQDLSVKNYYSNFPDHLNVYENPNISKSSTFYLIADKFSSLDDITQNVNRTEQPFLFNSFISDSISISTSVNISLPKNFTVSSSKVKYCLAGPNGVQGKALVRNSMLFSDLTSKCVLSIVLSMCFSNKHSSCNINPNKKSYSSLPYSDTSSKSSLSTVSQINTS